MRLESYSKGSCEKCGAHIEFPSGGIGQSISCPHCGEMTRLIAADAGVEGPASNPKKRPAIFLIALGSLALVAAMTIGLLAARKSAQPSAVEKADTKIKADESAPEKTPARKKPAHRAKNARTKPDFQANGLQAVNVTLEKPEGSRLIYATGTIRNQSDRQRFGVKVELDLFDGQGAKLGSATDYVQVIEPRKESRFRALVTEPKAASLKVTAILED